MLRQSDVLRALLCSLRPKGPPAHLLGHGSISQMQIMVRLAMHDATPVRRSGCVLCVWATWLCHWPCHALPS